jgi:hypothetical protein
MILMICSFLSQCLLRFPKGSPALLRSIASHEFVFVAHVRARLDFTVTFNGHDHDNAPRI